MIGNKYKETKQKQQQKKRNQTKGVKICSYDLNDKTKTGINV